MVAPSAPSPEDLRMLARQIRALAPTREGEMPFEVEAFLRSYS